MSRSSEAHNGRPPGCITRNTEGGAHVADNNGARDELLFTPDAIERATSRVSNDGCGWLRVVTGEDRHCSGARQQLEAWYRELPKDWRQFFHDRLRNNCHDETSFIAAVWELCVHHLLRGLPDVAVVDRDHRLPSGADVDYVLRYRVMEVACEAYVVQDTPPDNQTSRLLDDLGTACEQRLPPGYHVQFIWDGPPKTRRQVREIVDHILAEIQRPGWQPPSTIYGRQLNILGGGECIESVHVIEDQPGCPTMAGHIGLGGPWSPKSIADRVRAKARSKRLADGTEMALLLCLGYSPTVALYEPTMLALCYGPGGVSMDLRTGETREAQRTGGLFTLADEHGLHAAYLSGVVASSIALNDHGWALHPIAYLNPRARCPVPPEMLLPAMRVYVNGTRCLPQRAE